MKTKKVIYSIVIATLLFNCSSGGDDPVSQPDPNPTTKITYNANVKSIMTNNCIQCHGSPTTQNAPMSLTTFTQVKNNINGIISRINNASSPMPQSGLMPQSTRDLIQQWKDDGLLEN